MSGKRTPMTDAQLVAHIELLESQAIGAYDTDVASEQAMTMDYYHNRPFGTEEEGRSQVISSDVWDVVEGLTPLVLKPFVSSDDLVKFSPVGPEDEEAAEQESDYINYVVTQKNDVFETLVSWVKTGLLQKNGVVKYWWEKSQRKAIERYDGLSDDVFSLLLQDKNIAVVEHTESADDEGLPVHDVVLRITSEEGQAKYCVIPPEEFLISRDATSANPKMATFVQHRTRRTISYLREMGYDIADNVNDQTSQDPRSAPQYLARHTTDDTMQAGDAHGNDPSMREVLYRESHLLVDADGDGVAELRKVCVVGDMVLANEEAEEIPFCAWTPYLQSFKFYGKCPGDESREVQLIKSTLLRQTMDNIYSINNNRTYVGKGVNVDDLIDNQIGGFIRFDGADVRSQVQEAQVTPINAVTMPMVEYFDSAKENRTGFTRYNQGTDSNSLNKTATGIRIISEAGNERVGLTSRSFAELGLKPLMIGIHGLCRRHATKAETVKLRGKWVDINPRDWKTRYDMTVSVGLGTADKTMQMQGAQLLLEKQMELMPTGIVTPKNLYASSAKLAQAVGEKNPDRYFTAPPEEAPPAPDPMENPEVMFKVKESKQKDRELDLKERELTGKEAQAKQDFELRQHESQRTGLVQYHELERGMQDTAEPEEPQEDAMTPALEEIKQGQEQLADALLKFAEMFQESNDRIVAAIEESGKHAMRPQTLRVQKQADGSFVGVREHAKEE